MIILCDVDGVIANFVGGVVEFLKSRGFQKQESDFTEFDMSQAMTPDQKASFSFLGTQNGFCTSIPWYPQAALFLKVLLDLGTVYALTAPWKAPTWESERREWLSHVLPSDRMISCPPSAKHLIRGDVLIEDHPGTAAKWSHENPRGVAILLDRPWNREGSATWAAASLEGNTAKVRRVRDYKEAIHAIMDL